MIETGFGSFPVFNAMVRSIFEERSLKKMRESKLRASLNSATAIGQVAVSVEPTDEFGSLQKQAAEDLAA